MKRFLFLGVLGFFIFSLGTSLAQGGIARAMWVWDANIVKDDEATDSLIDFCRDKDIKILYLSAYLLKGRWIQDYRKFNRKAHSNGISVCALAGDPRWGQKRYFSIVQEWADSVIAFNENARPQERFDGLHLDVEVYLLSKMWNERPAELLGDYLQMNKELASFLDKKAQNLSLGVDVPFWFDDDVSYRIKWQGQVKAPSHHTLDVVDYIAVMDYRNTALGDDGIIKLAATEVDYASSIDKKVFIGLETQEDIFPKYITFGSKDIDYMEGEMKKVIQYFARYTGFGGIALHHYKSYRILCERKD